MVKTCTAWGYEIKSPQLFSVSAKPRVDVHIDWSRMETARFTSRLMSLCPKPSPEESKKGSKRKTCGKNRRVSAFNLLPDFAGSLKGNFCFSAPPSSPTRQKWLHVDHAYYTVCTRRTPGSPLRLHPRCHSALLTQSTSCKNPATLLRCFAFHD